MRRLVFIVIVAAWLLIAFVDCSFHDNRALYFAGDEDTEETRIDINEPVDEGFIRKYTKNQDQNGYWLFTRKNPVTPQILRYKDKKTLKNSNFCKNYMVVVLVHGWKSSGASRINTLLTEAFLHKRDLNVIVFDWSEMAARNYMTAKKGVLSVGRNLGQFIAWLKTEGVSLENMHLVGHSLGGHLVGNAGRYLKGAVKRITALDPAALFWSKKGSGRLTETDGKYVEVIHTNTNLLGYADTLGDTDFYPNGGGRQPGCLTSPCSHSRAYEYMAASVMHNHLKAQKCTSLGEMHRNRCDGKIEMMGNSELKKKPSGIYRVNTEKVWPYNVRD